MPTPKLTRWSLRKFFGIAWPFIALIVVGGVLRLKYKSQWPYSVLVFPLASTLFSIGVAGLIVDFWMLHKLLVDVGEYISGRIVAAHLPIKLRQQITAIIRTSLVRNNYQRTYRFTRSGDSLIIESTLSGTVKNYGDATVEYRPDISEEIRLQPEFLYLSYANNVFDHAKLTSLAKKAGSTDTMKVDGIPGVNLEPGQTFDTRFTMKITTPLNYSDITSLVLPTEDFRVVLEGKQDWLEFNVVSSGDKEVQHIDGSCEWYCAGPFIGGQHVNVYFKVRDEDGV
jgi:hypothetical protein